MADKKRVLHVGDVIRTEPSAGYWGCAVVLSEFPATERLRAMCHIGITPIVKRHAFGWDELEPGELSVLQHDRSVRVGEGQYSQRRETAIGLWANFKVPPLVILGKIDPDEVYSQDLSPEAGDGTGGRFPHCGSLYGWLGGEAVGAWRKLHDADAFKAEIEQGRREFELLEQRRLADAREKARLRRAANK